MLRRDFAKALIAAGVGIAAPPVADELIVWQEPTPPPDDSLLLLDDAQRLTVKPGDVVVLTFSGLLTRDQAARIRDYFKPVFPDNTVLVLDSGATIGVMGA